MKDERYDQVLPVGNKTPKGEGEDFLYMKVSALKHLDIYTYGKRLIVVRIDVHVFLAPVPFLV